MNELTPEQEAMIPSHAEKWIKLFMCTEPINFKLAKQAVIRLYELSGLKQPRQIMKINLSQKIENDFMFNTEISRKVTNAAIDIATIDIATIDIATIDIINEINRKIGNIINEKIQNIIDAIVNNLFGVSSSVCMICGGSIHSRYYARSSFLRDILNIKLSEKYKWDEQIGLNSFFCIFDKDTVYICDRPKSIKTQIINNTYRLHNNSGPAIQWRDNSKHWFIEGISVDEQIVMKPETQTIDQINNERNEERRRIRIEQYGWLKYSKNSGAKLINSRINERDNQQEQLYQAFGFLPNRFVCVDPSTGRQYTIAVPNDITTCLEAQKYLSHGLDKFAIHRS